VRDQFGNPMGGVSVAFTAPASGASGTFSNNGTAITLTTNASGQAGAAFAAGTVAGSYSANVQASGGSNPSTSLSLTNTAGAFAAGTVAGSYNVNVEASGGTNPSTPLGLTNAAGAASSINVTAGDGQSAVVNTAFASLLQVRVTDVFGNAVSGVSVTFAAPSS